jgi:hypothetical protein
MGVEGTYSTRRISTHGPQSLAGSLDKNRPAEGAAHFGGKMIVKCEQCGKEFDIPAGVVAIGKGRFCSKPCYDKWKTGRPRKESLEERLWNHVDRSGGPDACWPFVGWKVNGYGKIGMGEKVLGAHRVAYQVTNGTIPEGQCVCHRCDNPACCNPAHLFLGTIADNVEDCVSKGRRHYALGIDNHRKKLNPDSVREIRRLRAEGKTLQSLANAYGVSTTAITLVCNRRNWAYID